MTIKELRKITGLSQRRFADYFGLNVRTLQDWELGRTQPPVYLPNLLERILKMESMNDSSDSSALIYKDRNGVVLKTDEGIIVKNNAGRVLFEGKPNFDYVEDSWCLGTYISGLLNLHQVNTTGFNYNYDESFWK